MRCRPIVHEAAALNIQRASGRIPLSVFIICHDEIDTIGPCLESVSKASDIVIVDSGSTDGTVCLIERFILQGYPIRLFQRAWPGFARQKQFALDQCREEWCLSLDADERVDEKLWQRLPALMDESRPESAWRIRFRMHLYAYGYTPDGVLPTKGVRLFRKAHVRYPEDVLVHETVKVDGKTGDVGEGYILHARSLPISEQLAKEDRYSSLKSKQLFRNGRKASWSRLVFNPPLYFYRIFFRRGLFRCGKAGFVEAGTGALYSFLTEAKLFQLHAAQRFKDPSAAD
jgi:glycosyltransferase involved in cell wall biosynthesis